MKPATAKPTGKPHKERIARRMERHAVPGHFSSNVFVANPGASTLMRLRAARTTTRTKVRGEAR